MPKKVPHSDIFVNAVGLCYVDSFLLLDLLLSLSGMSSRAEHGSSGSRAHLGEDVPLSLDQLDIADPIQSVLLSSGSDASDNRQQTPISVIQPHFSSSSLTLQINESDFVDQKPPRSNLEAIYVHQSPLYDDGLPSSSSRSSSSRNAARSSLGPHAPTGNSTSSVDKRSLLAHIISNDPVLREQGIRVVFRPDLHTSLDAHLRDRIAVHHDSHFMSKWLIGLLDEIESLQNTYTDEMTTTGVFLTTIYQHCNRFLQEPKNFTDFDETPTGIWTDPPTTPVSVLDLSCWIENRCCHGVEHKRRKVCTAAHLREIQRCAGQEVTEGEKGIHIIVEDGALQFYHLNDVGPLKGKIELVLSQVSSLYMIL